MVIVLTKGQWCQSRHKVRDLLSDTCRHTSKSQILSGPRAPNLILLTTLCAQCRGTSSCVSQSTIKFMWPLYIRHVNWITQLNDLCIWHTSSRTPFHNEANLLYSWKLHFVSEWVTQPIPMYCWWQKLKVKEPQQTCFQNSCRSFRWQSLNSV